LRTLSIALYGLYGSVPELISLDLANAFLFMSYALAWSGARVFDGRRPQPGWLITGATVWVLACQVPQFAEMPDVRALLGGGIVAAFLWLTAFEFWRGRAERLLSRWPAILILFAHGAIFLLRSPISLLLAVGSEIIGGAPGIGNAITLQNQAGNVPAMWVYIVVSAVLGVVANLALIGLERRVLKWHSAHRSADVA